MKTTELLVQNLDLSIDPSLEDRHFGWVDIEFRVIGDPEYLNELGVLKSEFGLEIDLKKLPNPLINEIEEEQKVGEIEIEAIAIIEGEEDEFEDYITQWKEDNYRSLPFMFRYHIESTFVSEIMAPLSSLLNNTFRGIVPQVTFTENPPDIEGENYDLNLRGIDLEEENQERLQQEIEGYHEEVDSARDSLIEEIEEIIGDDLGISTSIELRIGPEEDDEQEEG
jgi:hypothetical protein